MRATRIFGTGIAILIGSMLISARTGAPAPCAPGVASSLCSSASGHEQAGPETLLVRAEVGAPAPAAVIRATPATRRPPFRGDGIPPLAADRPMAESASLVLLGMVLVVAAWTLRHAKAG